MAIRYAVPSTPFLSVFFGPCERPGGVIDQQQALLARRVKLCVHGFDRSVLYGRSSPRVWPGFPQLSGLLFLSGGNTRVRIGGKDENV